TVVISCVQNWINFDDNLVVRINLSLLSRNDLKLLSGSNVTRPNPPYFQDHIPPPCSTMGSGQNMDSEKVVMGTMGLVTVVISCVQNWINFDDNLVVRINLSLLSRNDLKLLSGSNVTRPNPPYFQDHIPPPCSTMGSGQNME
nr:hypothetical protein [Tanacetum cinerariifolium]